MEIWKDIPGHPGYQISTDGRVKSCVNNRYGIGIKCRELSQHTNAHGYKTVHLGRDNNKLVHRLVALTHIPNPDNYPLVRHLDDDPSNNNVENLAWGTQTDNMQDCVKHGRLVGDTKDAINSRKKKVIAIPKNGGDSKIFDSVHEAARNLGVWPQHICSVIQGKISQTGGWYFRYDVGCCNE